MRREIRQITVSQAPSPFGLSPKEESGLLRKPPEVVQVAAVGAPERLPALAVQDGLAVLDLARLAAVTDLSHLAHLSL
jgi:hypothetical protein